MASGQSAPPMRGASLATAETSPPSEHPAALSTARARRRALAIVGSAAFIAVLVAFAIVVSAATSNTLTTILLVATVVAGALTIAFVLRGLWLAARSRSRPTRRSIAVVLVASGITSYFTILQVIQAWRQLPLH